MTDFYPLTSAEWKIAGLPCRTKAYELWNAGKLNLVRDPAGRTGVTRAEVERYFSQVVPLSRENKRDLGKAIAARKRQRASA